MTDIQAWLDEARALADQATEGTWEAYADSDYQPAGARTRLPQALDALQAVLEVHAPIDALNTQYTNGRIPHVCTGCGQDDGSWNYWPCPTVRAIQNAIKEQDA